MEMINVSRKEIENEMFLIDTEDDFVYMIEKTLGSEAGRYARQLVEEAISADEYFKEICDYEKEVDKLTDEVTRLENETIEKKHFSFVFVKE